MGYARVPSINDLNLGERVKNNETSFEGFSIELLDMLQRSLNFTYSLHEIDGFGSLRDDGSWNGLVGAIVDGHLDFGANMIR